MEVWEAINKKMKVMKNYNNTMIYGKAVMQNETGLNSIKEKIYKYGKMIRRYLKPISQLELEAVREHPDVIKHLSNPSERAQIEAVTKDASLIRYIPNVTINVMLAAIRKDPSLILLYPNAPEEVKVAAVRLNADLIQHMKAPSELIQLAAIHSNARSILSFPCPPTEKVQIEVLTRMPELSAAMKNITTKAYKTAIENLCQIKIKGKVSADLLESIRETFDKIAQNENNSLKLFTKASPFSKRTSIQITKAEKKKIIQNFKSYLMIQYPDIIVFTDKVK